MQKKFSKKRITSFQEKVFAAVKKIPKGEVRSYKEVAAFINRPESARAVGNALNKNRDAQIPCHRVIRADGDIGGYGGGYGGGIKKKKELLQKEGVVIQGNRVIRSLPFAKSL
ncbi:MGMT family protein [Patescibacteria group bacterium]|nr:MGMT family protein [Patescibacteria group bacterium]